MCLEPAQARGEGERRDVPPLSLSPFLHSRDRLAPVQQLRLLRNRGYLPAPPPTCPILARPPPEQFPIITIVSVIETIVSVIVTIVFVIVTIVSVIEMMFSGFETIFSGIETSDSSIDARVFLVETKVSIAGKMVSGSEKMFSVIEKMVSGSEKMISKLENTFSPPKTMIDVTRRAYSGAWQQISPWHLCIGQVPS